MRVLYIGHYNEGSTSKMRGETIKDLLSVDDFIVVNIDTPLSDTPRLLRSIGWRYKIGPLIRNVNEYILKIVGDRSCFDIVWIDKGVFIYPEIVNKLKKISRKLVHFTPDPAFAYHQSRLFYKALHFYDFCITTKSYELPQYEKFGVKTIFCTQGFDPSVHKPYNSFEEKAGVVFIGHKEDDREYVVAKLLEKKICVTVAGNHWDAFSAKHRHNKFLIYKGKGLFGTDYAKELSKSFIGLGFLSKWVPELHTTRTFEIPACNTALLTERTPEISAIFKDDAAIFYSSPNEAVLKVSDILNDKERLKGFTAAGNQTVINGGYSYRNILKRLLTEIGETTTGI